MLSAVLRSSFSPIFFCVLVQLAGARSLRRPWVPREHNDCPRGWKQNGTSCYQIFGLSRFEKYLRRSWWRATEYCASRRARLVSLADAQEMNFIVAMVYERLAAFQPFDGVGWFPEGIWFGLRRFCPNSDKFSWIDGSSDEKSQIIATFTNNSVDEDCAMLQPKAVADYMTCQRGKKYTWGTNPPCWENSTTNYNMTMDLACNSSCKDEYSDERNKTCACNNTLAVDDEGKQNWMHFARVEVCMSPLAFICEMDVLEEKNGQPEEPTIPKTPKDECPENWCEYDGNCFGILPTVGTWEESKAHCQSIGANLASVHSAEENILAFNLTVELDQVWIGLHDHRSPVAEQFWWSDGSAVDYVGWLPGEPNSNGAGHTESCLVTSKYALDWHVTNSQLNDTSLTWNDVRCDKSLFGICKKPRNTHGSLPVKRLPITKLYCKAGWVEYNGLCFFLNKTATRYNNTLCHISGLRTFMAHIRDAFDNAFLQMMLVEADVKTAWIGLVQNAYGSRRWLNEEALGELPSKISFNNDQPRGVYNAAISRDGNGYCFRLNASSGVWITEVIMSSSGARDTICGAPDFAIPFICTMLPSEKVQSTEQQPKKSHCKLLEFDRFYKHCYRFFENESASWEEAENRCKQLAPESELVSVVDDLEWSFLVSRLHWKWMSTCWTGLHLNSSLENVRFEATVGDTFVWADNTSLASFQRASQLKNQRLKRKTLEGNARCLSMQLRRWAPPGQQFQWHISDCNNRFSFVCKYPAGEDKEKDETETTAGAGAPMEPQVTRSVEIRMEESNQTSNSSDQTHKSFSVSVTKVRGHELETKWIILSGVLGSLLLAMVVVVAVFLIRRRRRATHQRFLSFSFSNPVSSEGMMETLVDYPMN